MPESIVILGRVVRHPWQSEECSVHFAEAIAGVERVDQCLHAEVAEGGQPVTPPYDLGTAALQHARPALWLRVGRRNLGRDFDWLCGHGRRRLNCGSRGGCTCSQRDAGSSRHCQHGGFLDRARIACDGRVVGHFVSSGRLGSTLVGKTQRWRATSFTHFYICV